MSADVDDLKSVNDRRGHAAGDELICAAADFLQRHGRSADRVARVGGDEFLILMPDTDEAGGARYLARVRAELRRTRSVGARPRALLWGRERTRG